MPQKSKKDAILKKYDEDLNALENKIKFAHEQNLPQNLIQNLEQELTIKDQAYEQAYEYVNKKKPEWKIKLDTEVSKQQKSGEWFKLGLEALNIVKPHLEKAVQAMFISPVAQNKIPLGVNKSNKPQSEQRDSKPVKPIVSAESIAPLSPVKETLRGAWKTVKPELRPELPAAPALTQEQIKPPAQPADDLGLDLSYWQRAGGILDGKNPLNPHHIMTLAMLTSCKNSSGELDTKLLAEQRSLAGLALAKGADANEIYNFGSFPPDDTVNLLLNAEKPLSPNRLLKLVLKVSCENSNGEPDAELLARQRSLMELAVAKGADANEVYFFGFPSPDVIDFLLNAKKPLDPDHLLFLILDISCRNSSGELDDKLLTQRHDLMELAVAKGADLNKFPQINSFYQLGQQFAKLGMADMKNALAAFISEQGHTKNATALAGRIRDKGQCYALTTLWLYSKWLQFEQPQKSGGYNQNYDKDWFSNTIAKISILNQHQTLSKAEIADIKKFALQLDFMMAPRYYIEGFRPADTKIHETDNRLTTDGKILREQYKIAATFDSPAKLAAFLKAIVREDTLIYLVTSRDDINNPAHFVGLFKHDGKYYRYDPNDSFGETRYNSIEEVANKELEPHGPGAPARKRSYGFIVSGFDQNYTSYPSQAGILDTVYPSSLKSDTLEADAMAAILVRSPESLRFFLDRGLDPRPENKDNISLLERAIMANAPEIIAILLKEYGMDPRWASNKGDITNFTGLHIAAKRGYFNVVKVLLDDPRTNINQKDSTGKTALDYVGKDYKKTRELIVNANKIAKRQKHSAMDNADENRIKNNAEARRFM